MFKPPKNQNKAPKVKASIDWVHGYRGFKCRNNINVLQDGSIAYHVAGLGVVYDPSSDKQRHFDHHADDITSMAFSKDGRTIATGEVGKDPSIYVWDAMSMGVIHHF